MPGNATILDERELQKYQFHGPIPAPNSNLNTGAEDDEIDKFSQKMLSH